MTTSGQRRKPNILLKFIIIIALVLLILTLYFIFPKPQEPSFIYAFIIIFSPMVMSIIFFMFINEDYLLKICLVTTGMIYILHLYFIYEYQKTEIKNLYFLPILIAIIIIFITIFLTKIIIHPPHNGFPEKVYKSIQKHNFFMIWFFFFCFLNATYFIGYSFAFHDRHLRSMNSYGLYINPLTINDIDFSGKGSNKVTSKTHENLSLVNFSSYGSQNQILNGHHPRNPELLEYMYFSIYTITTTGYGDILPSSAYSKSLVVFTNILEIFFMVIFFNVLLSIRKDPLNRRRIILKTLKHRRLVLQRKRTKFSKK